MATKHIPEGYHTITPSIIVRDAREAIEFYGRAFGAEAVTLMTDRNGAVMHAEIRIGDSILMMGEENEQWGMRSPLSLGGSPSSLHIYVEDADAVFARAVEAGAKVRYPMEDAFWGDRYGKITDPFGHEWGIATHVKDLSEEEIRRAGEEWMAKMESQPAEA
ncbi:MAG TPA: VOC family protein [Gemmatimonadales bacterium]